VGERQFGGQGDIVIVDLRPALEGGLRPRGFQDDQVGAVTVHIQRGGQRGDGEQVAAGVRDLSHQLPRPFYLMRKFFFAGHPLLAEGVCILFERKIALHNEDAFARRDPTTFSPEEYERWSCTPYARSIAHDVERALTNVEAHPVLRISQTEGAVLSKIDLMMLLVALAALTAALLGVASTMTTTVLERKSEIGLLKAIGASNLDVTMIFLAETGLVGMIGGLAGLGLGWGLAQIVARSVFGSAIEISAVLAPMVIVVSIAVAFIGSALPLRRALRFEPSVVLRER